MLIASSVTTDSAPSADTFESESQAILVSSTALGDFEVSSTAQVQFLEPLGGFSSHLHYVIVPAVRQGLWWLQSLHDANVTFLLADPFVSFPDYTIDITDAERVRLGIEREVDAFALVMLTLPTHHGESVTANCRAPIVFNLEANCAIQVVSRNETHTMRTPINLSVYEEQSVGLRMQ